MHETERLAGSHDLVVDAGHELRGNVELPAEFADVGDARGAATPPCPGAPASLPRDGSGLRPGFDAEIPRLPPHRLDEGPRRVEFLAGARRVDDEGP